MCRQLSKLIGGGMGLFAAALVLAACGQATSSTSQTAQPPVQASEPSRAPVAATEVPAVKPAAVAPTSAPVAPTKPAPELIGGGAWLNSSPLTLEGLRGKVVLIDFWTYGCINCQRTLPSVRGWWDKYKDQGLVIIGVHTPEFQHEHDLANVQAAVERLGVTWPVVQDNDSKIWRAYRNNYWPRFYLIDKQGNIIYDHIGEGAYEETERQIVQALSGE